MSRTREEMAAYDERFHRAERAARSICSGSRSIYDELMRQWRRKHPEPIDVALRYLVGLLEGN